MLPLLQTLLTLAILWHVLAFAAGAVFVWFSYRALFGFENYESFWGKIIRRADLQLWLSGLAVIAFGALLSDVPNYFANPKLWAKLTVIFVWFSSTQFLRRIALPKFRNGERRTMIFSAAVNLSCWIYGAFLGCAKSLSYTNGDYSGFLLGFALTMAACIGLTAFYEHRRKG